MFYFWTSLKEIVLPSNVLYIDDYAFSQCSALESVVIPEKVKFIGYQAFNNCELLSSLEIPSSSELDSIASNAFYNTGLKTIKIPDNVRYIGENAFNLCNSLTYVTLPSSLKGIENSTFANCDSLQSIAIPDKVKRNHQATNKKSHIHFLCIWLFETHKQVCESFYLAYSINLVSLIAVTFILPG